MRRGGVWVVAHLLCCVVVAIRKVDDRVGEDCFVGVDVLDGDSARGLPLELVRIAKASRLREGGHEVDDGGHWSGAGAREGVNAEQGKKRGQEEVGGEEEGKDKRSWQWAERRRVNPTARRKQRTTFISVFALRSSGLLGAAGVAALSASVFVSGPPSCDACCAVRIVCVLLCFLFVIL